MPGLEDKKIFRVLDANLNRAKEGLRVCEDVARFILDEGAYTKRYKAIRHRLSKVCALALKGPLIAARAIGSDVGTRTSTAELKRKNAQDIFYANSQRVKESIRVLEEFFKLLDARQALKCKKMRYQIYALEQEIFERLG